MLYILRGWWHEATPIGETFHIAIGMHKPSILHYIAWLVQGTLLHQEQLRITLKPSLQLDDSIQVAAQIIATNIADTTNVLKFLEMQNLKKIQPRRHFSLDVLKAHLPRSEASTP